jgi:carotene epsilon-monooxygenase
MLLLLLLLLDVRAQVAQFLFGDGFAISGGEQWRMRRRAVSPSLHR